MAKLDFEELGREVNARKHELIAANLPSNKGERMVSGADV